MASSVAPATAYRGLTASLRIWSMVLWFLAMLVNLLGGVGDCGEGRAERAERPVDVDQRLLLPLGQDRVGQDGQLDRPHLPVLGVEDPGLHVELFGRDPQCLG